MTTRYLTFDGGCGLCSGIADEVERISGGWLTARSMQDPEVQALMRAHGKDGLSRPALVVVDGERVTVSTGPVLSGRLAAGIGLRRAMAVLGVVHRQVRDRLGAGRRGFLRAGAQSALVVGGLMAVPAAASAAATTSASLSGEKLAVLVRAAVADARYTDLLATAKAAGFSSEAEHVGLTLDDGELLFAFLQHADDPEHRAAVLTWVRSADGAVDATLEEVNGDPAAVASASTIDQSGAAISVLTAPGVISTLGAKEYFGCIASCVGANCGAQAARCANLRIMQLVLACMAAICGSKVNVCHRVCKSRW